VNRRREMHWLDPDYLPEVSGTVDRFLLNLRGDADGMILTDGTEIHFPPHMSAEICCAIRPNDVIKVRGVRPRSAGLIAAVAIETADGKRIVDNGPPKDHQDEGKRHKRAAKVKHEPMQAEGTVRLVLHGPKGDVRGALLEDGQIVRIAPPEADRIQHLLSPGTRLAVRGEGLASEFGTVIDAREAGASQDSLQPLKPKDGKHRHHDADSHAA
jgi:hypothetical protein